MMRKRYRPKANRRHSGGKIIYLIAIISLYKEIADYHVLIESVEDKYNQDLS